VAIGFAPAKETLNLSLHADFIHVLSAPPGSPFPASFTAKIEILAADYTVIATWNPTVTSTTAITWNIQSNTAVTGVDAVIASGAKKFRLYAIFPSTPTDDYLWYAGSIKIIK
jgi:hypothetical protein